MALRRAGRAMRSVEYDMWGRVEWGQCGSWVRVVLLWREVLLGGKVIEVGLR